MLFKTAFYNPCYIPYIFRMSDWSLLRGKPGTDFLSSLSNYSNHEQALSQLQMMNLIDNHNFSTASIYDENTFCTPDNVDECITHLNQVFWKKYVHADQKSDFFSTNCQNFFLIGKLQAIRVFKVFLLVC